MKKLLVINASARTLNSNSRELTEVFINHWKSMHDNPTISFRELGNTDVPHINEEWITATFTPEMERTTQQTEVLKTSNAYISDLRTADVIVVGAPMYNWSVPSVLKAYLDQVLRVNETFRVDRSNAEKPYIGLLQNKTLFLLLSRGDSGYEKGGHNEHLDFQTPYLKTVFNLMGISNIHVITVDGTAFDEEHSKLSIAASHKIINELIVGELIEQ